MPITTLPNVAEFGGTKVNEYAVADATKQCAAEDYNALTGRMVAAFEAIGLDNGTTAGSLRAGQAPASGTSSASQSWTTARGYIVNHNDCELTLNANTTQWPVGEVREVVSPYDYTYRILVPTGHGLNNVEDGEGPWLGGWAASASYSSSCARITRLSSTDWAWSAVEAPASVQVVNANSATITARHVIVTYTVSPVTLTLPDASAGRELTIWKANGTSAAQITLARSASDAGGGGQINGDAASLVLDQGYFGDVEGSCWHVVGQGPLAWWVDPTWEALAEIKDTLDAAITNLSGVIGAEGYGEQVISGTSGTITDAKDVFVTNTGATINVTLPAATAARAIRLHKANSATTQTINLVRDDIAETINGATATYALTWTSVASGAAYATVDVACGTTGAWHADGYVPANATASAANTASIATNTTGITNLQGGFVPSANVRNLTSGTTATILAGETIVRQGSANAMALTLPAATLGAQIDIIKDTTNAGTITLIRAGSDTIHGSASNYVLDGSTYVTSATTYRRRWTVTCLVAGEWTVT
jgi:hypothetical protein